MAGYWLKLYTEILDDPKYYRLSGDAKLGMYELMLVAKKIDQNGMLPSIDDICFYTRRDADWWIPVIDELKRIKFITDTDEGNEVIRKFEDRQSAVPSNEKQRRYREALHKKEVSRYEPVTDALRNVTESKREIKRQIKSTERETETENRGEEHALSPVQQMIESVVGLSPGNSSDLKALDEITLLNPTQADIQEAYNWLTGQGKRVRYYSSLVGPVRTALAKRVQRPMSTPLERSKAAVLQVLEESGGDDG